MTIPLPFPDSDARREVQPFKLQLLKWIGNKQRFAHEIALYFPVDFGTYYEPFLGSGAVLGTLIPERGVGADAFSPLIEIWQSLKATPEVVKSWYEERWHQMMDGDKVEGYEQIKAAYNRQPNGADLLFLSRSCYGGVVRFRKADGYMSTPCGPHTPVSPESFARRADEWHRRIQGTEFIAADFEETMDRAEEGDLIYCDPPYTHTQAIIYGAQSFDLQRLLATIQRCKERGVFVALSIDGRKRDRDPLLDLPIPEGLFEEEALVNCGRSMLKRFQMGGSSLEGQEVSDRLLLTW